MQDVQTRVAEVFDEVVALRRDFHAHPELGQHETRTTKIIAEKLREYGLDEVHEGVTCFGTGVVGVLYGTAGKGNCIALRADIDALPLQETSDLPFASTEANVMHACAHDGHAAMLLGTAKVLVGMKNQLRGTVKFLFQPSEEVAPDGGAKPMVEAGALENPHVDAILSCHLMPTEQPGPINLYKGAVTTAVDLYDVIFIGKSGHGSQPHTANDAILAACQYVVLLQQIVSRKTDPMEMLVMGVGLMEGGTAENIIAGNAKLRIVSRAYSTVAREVGRQQVSDIADGVAKLSGCTIEVKHTAGYHSVFNDAEMIDLIESSCKEALGEDSVHYLEKPMTFSEDYSYYRHAAGIPSAQVFIDAGHLGDELFPLHHPKMSWQEDAMKKGIAMFAASACQYLK